MTDESEQNNEDQLQQIKDDIGEKYQHSELHINRVPDHTIEDFKQLASDKFANDYGMALTFLLELYSLKNEFDSQLAATTDKVMELEEEVQQLKNTERQKQDDSKPSKKTVG